ncbi:molybdate transport system substrate-binding protein [Jannaschia faecimaris]|uniref:Molybdate transport system substrate-binding protein n=1 Tax=Jannaschia faecimaris TaxID=1244108 RepID=A0A1H3NLW9_9RHOB|nr:molybdate ABC transporter substrate-binding protein [Jannaschia faecimaris]SDY89892.1 molybdate transport system substrate-binding protein [Jannaschia faecimaris]
MANPIRSDITRRGLLGSALALIWVGGVRAAERPVTVFAAASLKPALDEIAKGWDVALAYGGSGSIARQVAAGAPADIVILAATDWMDWLVGQGVLSGTARVIARNRLVLAGAPGVGPVALTRDGVMRALGTGRLAMGDPLSVPAGRYARHAFETLGLWTALSNRLILTEDVRAALAYVARGDVALGAVYASDVVGTDVEIAARIPSTAHAPIVYPGAVVSGRPDATVFLDHVAGATEILAAHGFAP